MSGFSTRTILRGGLFAAALLVASPSRGQLLGQFTTAAPSALGEGTLFMLAGNDAFRTGIAARFVLTRSSDLGIQLGLDRLYRESYFGGGVDLKATLVEHGENLPLDLALDASGGWLQSDDWRRFEFGFGILASGFMAGPSDRAIEPYMSFSVVVYRSDRISDIACGQSGADCPNDGQDTETESRVRLGVRIPVSRDSRVYLEASINGEELFGAGFNVIF